METVEIKETCLSIFFILKVQKSTFSIDLNMFLSIFLQLNMFLVFYICFFYPETLIN